MSHDGSHVDHREVEGVIGMAAELAKQSGYISGSAGNAVHHVLTHGQAGQAGAALATAVAPLMVVAAPVAVPIAVVSGIGYGLYRLCKWLGE